MDRIYKLQEKAKKLGKTLLIESFDYENVDTSLVEIYTNNKLTEATDGKTYDCLAILRNVPVSRYTLNRNGRIYTKPVWDIIQRNGSFNNGFCLADHAQDDGESSVTSIAGVWKNFRAMSDVAYADLCLLDNEHGNRILDIIKVGGRTGFSSVGFGELDDNKSVIPESFQLSEESVCDHVLVPSQRVYATNENLEDNIDKKPSFDKVFENKKNHNTNININGEKPKTEIYMSEKIEKALEENKSLNESTIKNHARLTIGEALRESNKAKAVKDLKEFQETLPTHMSEVHSKVSNAIDKINEQLEVEMIEKDSKLAEETKKNSNINTKYSEISKMYEDLRTRYQKSVKIAESKIKGDNVKLSETVKYLKEDYSNSLKDIKIFIQERHSMISDLGKLFIERGNHKKINYLASLIQEKSERAKFIKSMNSFAKKLKENEEIENEEPAFIDPTDPDGDNPEVPMEVPMEENEFSPIEDSEMEDSELEEDEFSPFEDSEMEEDEFSPIEDGEEDVYQFSNDEDENKSEYFGGYDGMEEDDSEEEDSLNDMPSEDDEFSENDDSEEDEFNFEDEKEEMTEEDDSEEEEEEEEELTEEDDSEEQEKKEKEEMMKEARKRNNLVSTWFESHVKKYPALKDVKKQILASKNLKEAQEKASFFLKKGKDKSVSMKENTVVSRPSSWLPKQGW